MATKSNPVRPIITDAYLKQQVSSAFDSMVRSKDSAAEASAIVYLIGRDCSSGPAADILKRQIDIYNDALTAENNKIDDRFERAEEYMRGDLSKDHEIYQKPKDEADRLRIADIKEQFRTDANTSKEDRRKLYKVLASAKESASRFTELVKFAFRFNLTEQASMASRYSLMLEWIAATFDSEADTDVDIDAIKAAIAAAHGFARCVELQRKANAESNTNSDEEKITAFIKEQARAKLKTMASHGSVPVTIVNDQTGFGLLLVRIDGTNVEVIGDAGLTDNDVERAIRKVTSGVSVDADPATEFMGRALRLGSLIQDGWDVTLDEGTGTVQRIVTMRPGPDGAPHLVFSLNWADASAVLHAKPREGSIMALEGAAAVLPKKGRDLLEKQLKDPARRALITISAELNPTTADGKRAEGPMSWAIGNTATTNQRKTYWSNLSAIRQRPLDVVNFEPQFHGVLSNSVIEQISQLIAKKTSGSKKSAADADGASATKAAKTPKTVLLTVSSGSLVVKFGDADALTLPFTNESVDTVKLRLRHPEAAALFKSLAETGCDEVEFSGDDRGLIKLRWSDAFGFYGFHQPTCGLDGKLLARLVAPMRNVIAAAPPTGAATIDQVIAAQQVAAIASGVTAAE